MTRVPPWAGGAGHPSPRPSIQGVAGVNPVPPEGGYDSTGGHMETQEDPAAARQLWARTDPWRRAMAVVRDVRGKVLYVDRRLPALSVPYDWTSYHWIVWGALFPRRLTVPDMITVPELVNIVVRKRGNWHRRGSGDALRLYQVLGEDSVLLFYPTPVVEV